MKHIILIIIILLSNIGYAGNIHHNISDKKYIEYAEKFDCIVRIEMKDNNGQISFGSGVLIKPRVILTAGHMIKDQRLVSVIFKSKKYRSSKFKCHPMFNETFGKDDIAIVKIEIGAKKCSLLSVRIEIKSIIPAATIDVIASMLSNIFTEFIKPIIHKIVMV